MPQEMDTYYQFIDRDTSTVSSVWKGVHITSLAIVICSGFISANAFGKAQDYFGNNCILYANISFLKQNSTENIYGLREVPIYLKPIDVPNSKWGSQQQCYFCQFTPVMSMICGVIWTTFFVMCSKGGAGYISDAMYRPWRLVYPALIFATVYTVIQLISTLQLSDGIKVFCEQFQDIFHTTECTEGIDGYTLLFYPKRKQFVIRLKLSLLFSYLSFFGWLMLLVSLILRIVFFTDFQMIQITVTNRGDIEEEVMEIIDPSYGDKTSIVTIQEDNKSVTSSQLSTPTATAKRPIFKRTPKRPMFSKNKPFRKHLISDSSVHSDTDQDQEPATDSSQITLSPDLIQGDDDLSESINIQEKKNGNSPFPHSKFTHPKYDIKSSENENIVLQVLNESPSNLTQNKPSAILKTNFLQGLTQNK